MLSYERVCFTLNKNSFLNFKALADNKSNVAKMKEAKNERTASIVG